MLCHTPAAPAVVPADRLGPIGAWGRREAWEAVAAGRDALARQGKRNVADAARRLGYAVALRAKGGDLKLLRGHRYGFVRS